MTMKTDKLRQQTKTVTPAPPVLRTPGEPLPEPEEVDTGPTIVTTPFSKVAKGAAPSRLPHYPHLRPTMINPVSGSQTPARIEDILEDEDPPKDSLEETSKELSKFQQLTNKLTSALKR